MTRLDRKFTGWLLLFTGVTVNLSGIILIKFGQNQEQPVISIAGYLAYFSGFYIITLSFKRLDIGLAYAIWSGFGSILTLVAGITFFEEVVSVQKMIFFALVFIGVVGMSLSG